MAYKVYRVMKEFRYNDADEDMCPIVRSEESLVDVYPSKRAAIDRAKKIWEVYNVCWVAVFEDMITQNGIVRGERIYNNYRDIVL